MYVYKIYFMGQTCNVFYKSYRTLAYAKKKLKEFKKEYPNKMWWIEKQKANDFTFCPIKMYWGDECE